MHERKYNYHTITISNSYGYNFKQLQHSVSIRLMDNHVLDNILDDIAQLVQAHRVFCPILFN